MKIRRRDKKSGAEAAVLSALIILGALMRAAASGGGGSRMLEAAHRQIRGLSYPEESEMGLFFALAIPLDDPVSTKAVSVAFFFEANYKLPNELEAEQEENERRRMQRSIDRRAVYAVIESKFESLGLPGRECLLRSICETAREEALHVRNGLVGDLMRITFTPSSSADEGLPTEYYAAAEASSSGGGGGNDCGSIYHRCPLSIYQHITDVLE